MTLKNDVGLALGISANLNVTGGNNGNDHLSAFLPESVNYMDSAVNLMK